MNKDKVLDFAKNNGYNYIDKLESWKEYDVYEPTIDRDNTMYLGLPYIILVSNNKVRMSTKEECKSYIKYIEESFN